LEFYYEKRSWGRLELSIDQKLAASKFNQLDDDVLDEVDGLVVAGDEKGGPAAVDGVDRQRLSGHDRRRFDAMLDGVAVQPHAAGGGSWCGRLRP